MPKIYGPELKARREALGLDQAGLAEKLGVHMRTVSKWERDVHAIPDMVTMALTLLEKKRPRKRRQQQPEQGDGG